MFRRSILSGSLALLVFSLFTTNQVQAQGSAGEVFRACQHELEKLTRECVAANHHVAEFCIPRIRELLENGQRERALRLARRCIHQIERQTNNCLDDMSHLCRRCVHRLLELGAPELAERFRHNCHVAAGVVRASARRAIQAIRDLFDEP